MVYGSLSRVTKRSAEDIPGGGGGQPPVRPVLNISARFCPGGPGILVHFLKISPKSALKQVQAELGILAYSPALAEVTSCHRSFVSVHIRIFSGTPACPQLTDRGIGKPQV
ncbi:uncharacterized protein M6G45_000236 [Spheniscus humboldti]